MIKTTRWKIDPIKRKVPFDVTVDDMEEAAVIVPENGLGIIAIASPENANLIVEAVNAYRN